MKKILFISCLLIASLSTKAQSFTSLSGGGGVWEEQVICIDTAVLNQGLEKCNHYYVSQNAEQLQRVNIYLIYTIRSCLPYTEDYLICAKCLRHLKIERKNECINVLPYSELLKRIETTYHYQSEKIFP